MHNAGISKLFLQIQIAPEGVQYVIAFEKRFEIFVKIRSLQQLNKTLSVSQQMMGRSFGVGIHAILYLDRPPYFVRSLKVDDQLLNQSGVDYVFKDKPALNVHLRNEVFYRNSS